MESVTAANAPHREDEMENKIENNAMFKLTYGLFVLSVNDGVKDNGCIVNTVSMLTENPKRITVCVNKLNYTRCV